MAYLPLSTANLPDPVIDPAQGASPEDYFNTVLYTGNGSTQSITGVGFQPDFVAIKVRSVASGHYDFDVLRGVQKRIGFNTNGAEITNTNSLTAFNSDGFSVGSEDAVNGSGRTIVAWNWKANGSGVSNTDGSITSTVSANTTSGFSIVSYTGDSTGTDGTPSTVGHGLSQAPEMIMFKPLDTYDGAVYHSGLTSASYRLILFSASGSLAEASDNGFFNGTAPTSSVFSIGSRKHTNSNGGMIAYCFHSVEGFSKFGSYVGNGSADGPFVYTGFRPAFVLFKKATGATQSWVMMDNQRDQFNVNKGRLFPDLSLNELTSAAILDFTSNGFKVRDSGSTANTSGETYIYMAFAENPFKYSNAR